MNERISLAMKAALALGVLLVIAAGAIAILAGTDADDDGEVAVTGEDTSGGDDAGGSDVEIPADAVDLRGQESVEVAVLDNVFEPQTIVVSPGTEVTWTNEGRNDHNVRPDEEGAFDAVPTEDLGRQMSASRVFDQPGGVGYYCSIHGAPGVGQFGTVIVAP